MIKVGDKVLWMPQWGAMGVTREASLWRSDVFTVTSVTKGGLITLHNGDKIRESGDGFRFVPHSSARDEWHVYTPELQAERAAAIRLRKLREKVGAIKLDTLTEAQCVGILAALGG